MPDPTKTVIISTFCAALGLFVVASLVRMLSRKAPVAEALPAGTEQSADSPYGSPDLSVLPPTQPPGRVPTWFYNPLDLLGMGLVFSVFLLLVWGSLQMATEKEPVLDPGG
ncbi:MAG: hypothetical protein EOP88_17850, partial [Verrucomicrobiaceae bacterium]